MNYLPSRTRSSLCSFTLVAVALLLCLSTGACKSGNAHTSDPKLKGIDELLAAQLPVGTPVARVTNFLNTRGYAISASNDSHAIVATVHHINTETVQPEAAKVTFHFDANDKLVSYDLEPASTMPMQ